MRILYAAGNYSGANIQASRFIANAQGHEIAIAAYLDNSDTLPRINWLLDALSQNKNKSETLQLLELDNAPAMNPDLLVFMLEDISNWKPDLAIVNAEPFVASIAASMDITTYYCSPFQLMNAMADKLSPSPYKTILSKFRSKLRLMPAASKNLVYSPFGDLERPPKLKAGYEWIRPYYEYPKPLAGISEARKKHNSFSYASKHIGPDTAIIGGQTNFLADCLYNDIEQIALSPDTKDPEAVMNAMLCNELDAATDLGMIDSSLQYAKNAITKITRNNNKISMKLIPELHEILCI